MSAARRSTVRLPRPAGEHTSHRSTQVPRTAAARWPRSLRGDLSLALLAIMAIAGGLAAFAYIVGAYVNGRSPDGPLLVVAMICLLAFLAVRLDARRPHRR